LTAFRNILLYQHLQFIENQRRIKGAILALPYSQWSSSPDQQKSKTAK
jgi:hypothetical protein